MRARTSLYLAAPAILLLAACGATGLEAPPDEKQAHLALIPSVASIDAGATIRLTLAAHAGDGTTVHPLGVVWRSSDLTVATIAEGGLVRGGSPGLAQITARWQDLSTTALVKVLPVIKKTENDPPCQSLASSKPAKDEDCPR